MGFTEVLTIVFITLKLTGVITWSWFWVLSPSIIGLGIVVVLVVGYIIIQTIVGDKKLPPLRSFR